MGEQIFFDTLKALVKVHPANSFHLVFVHGKLRFGQVQPQKKHPGILPVVKGLAMEDGIPDHFPVAAVD